MDCTTYRMDEDLASVGLLDDKTAELSAHLTDCEDCRHHSEVRRRARAALAPEPEECTPPAELWSRIEAAIDEGIERGEELEPLFAKGGDGPRLTLSLSCIYCHDALARNEAAYCASCLAPHHGDCFAEHGHCAAPGCDEYETVRPRRESAIAPTPTDVRPSWERQAGPAVGVFLLATVAVAALVDPGLVGREPQKVLVGKGAMAPIGGGEPYQTAVAPKSKGKGKVAGEKGFPWLRDAPGVTPVAPADAMDLPPVEDSEAKSAKDRTAKPAELVSLSGSGDSSKINVDVIDMDLRELCDALARRVGVNIVVAPGIEESVTVSLREIPWRQALTVICRMCRCEIEEGTGGLLLITQPPQVTIQFTEANVRTVLQLLAAYSGKNIVISNDVTGRVTCDLKDTRWDVALESLLVMNDLHARTKGTMIMVSKAKLDWGAPFTTKRTKIASSHNLRVEPHVKLAVSGTRTVEEICKEISSKTGIRIVVNAKASKAALDLGGVKSVAWQDLLVLAARNAKLELRDVGSHLRLTQTIGSDLRASGATAGAWLSALCKLNEVPIVISEAAAAVRVEAEFKDAGPGDALELTCRKYGLNLERVEGTVRITASADTKTGLAEAPATVPLNDGDRELRVALEAILDLPGAKTPVHAAVISGRLYEVGDTLVDEYDEESPFRVSKIEGDTVQIMLRKEKPGGTEARVVRTLKLRRMRPVK